MKTMLMKVKNPENCHKKGFCYLKKLNNQGLTFNRISIVNKENQAIGFILNPQTEVVTTDDVFNELANEEIFSEKPVATVKKQLNNQPQCLIFKLNPIARFGTNVDLEKPVRGNRYATRNEEQDCELELINTLIELGITHEELYEYCIRENLFDAYGRHMHQKKD